MEAQKVLELTKRPLDDNGAWHQIIDVINNSDDLDFLHSIIAGIREDDDKSLGLATIMYVSDKMARLFVPTVLAVKTNRDHEIITGLTVKYFDTCLSAAVLSKRLQEKEDSLEEKPLAVLLHIIGIAIAIHANGVADWQMFLSYLDED